MNGKTKFLRKNNSLLIEILIAFTLVILCIFPLLNPHLKMITYEQKKLEVTKLDRTLELLTSTIIKNLYENLYDWEQMVSGYQFPFYEHELKTSHYSGYWEVEKTETKKGKGQGHTYNLLTLRLTLFPKHNVGNKILNKSHQQTLKVFVERTITATESDNENI